MIKQANQANKNAISDHIDFMTVVRGIIISYIITIPTFIIFAFILTYTDFPEKLISPVVVITTIISILTAGSSATRNIKSKGWLNGGIVGLIYIAVLYCISSILFKNFAIDKYVITMAFIAVLTGAIGGILGINMKKGSPSKVKHKRA